MRGLHISYQLPEQQLLNRDHRIIMSSKCLSCQLPVWPRQQGLQCDGCLRWQHRTCGTGITQAEYHEAVNNGGSIEWQCSTCDVPLAESTPVLFDCTSASDNLSTLPDDPDQSTVYDPIPIEDPALDESSIDDPPTAENVSPALITFQIIEDSSKKGKPKLIDSSGYSYGVKRRRVNATDWVCTVRPKVNIATKTSKKN